MKKNFVFITLFTILIFIVSCGGNDSDGIKWSALSSNEMIWQDALDYCENLNEDGYSNWRLPNINEMRTLIQNCPGSQAGGTCAVSDPDHLASSDNWSDGCECESTADNGGYYSKIGDDDTVSPWSSSSRSDDTERAWFVGFFNGSIRNSQKTVTSDVRCVRNVE